VTRRIRLPSSALLGFLLVFVSNTGTAQWVAPPEEAPPPEISDLPIAGAPLDAVTDDADPSEIGNTTYLPIIIQQPSPKYPLAAHSACIDGSVRVSYKIERDGRVKEVLIQQSAHPLLEESVKTTILEQWRFEPFPDNEPAAYVWAAQTIKFVAGCFEPPPVIPDDGGAPDESIDEKGS
jgi:TonB family protein